MLCVYQGHISALHCRKYLEVFLHFLHFETIYIVLRLSSFYKVLVELPLLKPTGYGTFSQGNSLVTFSTDFFLEISVRKLSISAEINFR